MAEKDVWKLVSDLLEGLKLLHDNRILHRDLKPENIMVTDSHYKIADMNVSTVQKGDAAHTQIGTPACASPEVWQEQPYN